jgi:mono/diheme cytochrome c family protein
MRALGPPSRKQAGNWFIVPTVAALALGSAGAVFALEPDPDDEEITFARDVAPILQQNCQVCHQPGAIGPMSLMTYEEVRPWARVIKLRVEEREMPPYHYDVDVGIQELKHDGRLSDQQIQTISRWVDSGAPLGNPADMPPPVKWPDPGEYRLSTDLGQPDLIIKSDPFTVPASGQDLWWRPLVDSGLTSDRCIKAIEVKPSVPGRAVTHHANSNFRIIDEQGNIEDGMRLTEYALGKLGEIIPEGTCRMAPAGAKVAWDIHYYPMGEEVPNDVVEIGLWLYPEGYEAKYPQTLALYRLEGDIDLEPHGTAMTQGFHSFETPVRIDSFQPHGHLRLKAKSLEIFYPHSGRREMISMISNWNPGWHLSHVYEDHVAPLMPAGAIMIITAWYDNTADNRFNPDPDQWVGKGNRTTDEMSHAWIAITHLDDEGYQKLVAEREAMKGSTSTDSN